MPHPPQPNEDIGWRLIVFISLFTPLQIGIVAIRFYARSLTKFEYDLADALVVVALLAQILATGVDIGAAVQAGVGIHIEYLMETDPEKITLFFKYLVAISVWYFATITITKLAICKLYRTLFPHRAIYVLLYITAAILVATPIVTSITLLVACRPFSANWGSAQVQSLYCLNKEAIFVWGTIPNIVTDVVLLVIPLPVVWKLHTTTKMKLALTLTFTIGGLGLVASILRFISFFNTNSFTDATFNAVELIIWTLAEPGIYLISASLLVCRPLLEKMNTKWLVDIKHRLVLKYSTGARTHTTSQSLDQDPFNMGSGRSIALGNIGTQSLFLQLGDGSSEIEGRNAGQQIVVTTDIQQSWQGG
ncbi:putative integral membrane protein [Rosellinia necatrix]|uniref:Putative integral membrane protein n=1 Tax=Rosellinia necatrix TaxID=77044 RepID=A0A1W2TFZ0_ROSNE|nr:putative integral membrane protein [Rosellinia necatrix]